ncbi:hypothetical protein MJL33_33360, partial [Salmonella enterica subsp. enterica serovar Kentucky]|nr:hypothetical protein [Salmonella enterica subsp. enterica serovar Kentucky]
GGGFDAMQALLAHQQRPQAVFTGNDAMAVGAYQALYQAGLRIKYLAALGAWHCWETLPLLVFLAAMLACGRFGVALLVRGKSA